MLLGTFSFSIPKSFSCSFVALLLLETGIVFFPRIGNNFSSISRTEKLLLEACMELFKTDLISLTIFCFLVLHQDYQVLNQILKDIGYNTKGRGKAIFLRNQVIN